MVSLSWLILLWPVAPILLEVCFKTLVILLGISASDMALCRHSVAFATSTQLHSPKSKLRLCTGSDCPCGVRDL